MKSNQPITVPYNEPKLPSPDAVVPSETIFGRIAFVSSAPTWTPKTFEQQFAYYQNGATHRFYVYNFSANAWHYVALT